MSYPPPQGYYQQGGYPQAQAPPPGGQGYPPPQQQPPAYGQPPPVSQGYGAPQLSSQMSGMSLQQGPPRAGDTAILSCFTEGNVVILQSRASEKSLRVSQDGEVQGTGAHGPFAQFRVHVKRPGVVSLQNVKNPDYWLAVFQGKTVGTGKGGPYCEFMVNEIEGRFVALESVSTPGQYVGILPDGCVKPPDQTRTGKHGRFVVTVHVRAGPAPQAQPSPPQPHYPPPAQQAQPSPPQPHYPPPAQQGPPPAQYPVPGYPPPQQQPAGYPPPQAGYPPQQQQPPPEHQLPYGYKVTDAFQAGNVVQLISRPTGLPLQVLRGFFTSTAGQLGTTDSQWNVVVPQGCAPGVFMLHNVKWPGMYLAVKKGKVHNGNGGPFCHFVARTHPDNYVSFLSVANSNQYLAFAEHGNAVATNSVAESDIRTQFYIRINKMRHGHSSTISTPFGRASLANQLTDGCVVQLYLKSNNFYLSINAAGILQNIVNGNDKHTFFKVSDRGMGIYSLHAYKYPGYRVRMQNGALVGKGSPDLASDFRLKESVDGTVSFESVIQSGSYVGIKGPAGFQTKLYIFLVTIQKFGGSETITKTPLN
ncbi:uncharacterized protein LOC135335495 isoform X2 [Halichondria panicea]|uniref:uncharacterized protein LOC135335495 isoform X2 n=1 Tax=Halichondria panicea TaxID=6063 RepID=UPI00312BC30E